MAARRILQLGDPMLRRRSVSIASAESVVGVVTDLRDTLAKFRRTHGFGRGISAAQIGEPVRIIYLEFEGTPYTLINPEFERMEHPAVGRLFLIPGFAGICGAVRLSRSALLG